MSERRHETLDGIKVLGSLVPDVRLQLAARCTWRRFKPLQHVVQEGEERRGVLFLSEGTARATIVSENGKEITFRTIDAGEMFGELTAIDNEAPLAAVEAVTECTVATVAAEVFWEMLRTEPTIMAVVVKRLARQVRLLSDEVVEIRRLPVRSRIRAELLRIAERSMTAAGNAVLNPAPTNTDIALGATVTREAVDRELREMVAAGMMERRGRALVITSVDRLRQMLAGEG